MSLETFRSSSKGPPDSEKRIFEEIDGSSREYNIEGHRVQIDYKEFKPLQEVPKDKALLFLTGWSAGDAKTLGYQTACFAIDRKQTAFQVRTSTEGARSTALDEEAQAVQRFIKERNLNEVTLAAHSEGGIKTASLIDHLQKEDPDVRIRGLILIDPTGLYAQTPGHLTSAFVKDAMLRTPVGIAKNLFREDSPVKKGLQASGDIIFNILREIRATGPEYIGRLRSQVKAMAGKSEKYRQVRCPVVLIQGAHDPVSDREQVLPSDKDPRNLTARSEFLRESFFPNSSRVDYLVPERLGHHGLPHFRPEQVSRASLYLLEREERRERAGGTH